MFFNGLQIYKLPGDDVIVKAIHEEKRLFLENDMSAAYFYHKAPGTLIFFGKPDVHLVLEDLALRLDLK